MPNRQKNEAEVYEYSGKKSLNPNRIISDREFKRNLHSIVKTYLRLKGKGKRFLARAPYLIDNFYPLHTRSAQRRIRNTA